MKINTTTEIQKTYVLTLNLTKQEISDLRAITGLDVTIPNACPSPAKQRVTTILNELLQGLIELDKL